MNNKYWIILLFILNVLCTSYAFAQSSLKEFYTIGVDDVIEVKVLDHSDLKTVSTVASDGTITFPYIGLVNVKGLTISEVEKKISEKLSEGYVKYPVVTVSLVKSLSRKIIVYGEFLKRGVIQYDDSMTLEQGLSMAGGVTNDAIFGKVILKRKIKGTNSYEKQIEGKLLNGIIEEEEIADYVLMPDDIIIAEKNQTYLIQGEAARVGRFVLERDMTVLRALLQAGGVTKEGNFGTVRLRREQEGEKGKYRNIAESTLNDGKIEDNEVEEMLIQPDDVLVVERNKTFLIEGEVAMRGRLVLEKDMTVLKALLQAGGVTKEGNFGTVRLRRKQEGEKGKYRDIAESTLNDGKIEDNEVEETVIQPDDILVVERNKTFLIYGEVNKIGEFTLQKDMTVFKAVTIAGGFTKWGSGNRIKVLRSDSNGNGIETIKVNIKDVIDGDVDADLKLQSGDIIIVSSGIL